MIHDMNTSENLPAKDYRIVSYNDLTAHDILRINKNIDSMKNNYEGLRVEDCQTCLFLFYDRTFVILDVLNYRSGQELNVVHLGGTDTFKNGDYIWQALFMVANQYNCKRISGTVRSHGCMKRYRKWIPKSAFHEAFSCSLEDITNVKR